MKDDGVVAGVPALIRSAPVRGAGFSLGKNPDSAGGTVRPGATTCKKGEPYISHACCGGQGGKKDAM